MKYLTKMLILFFAFAIQSGINAQTSPEELQTKIDQYIDKIDDSPMHTGVRGDDKKNIAASIVFSEEVLMNAALDEGIKCSAEEVRTVLLNMLGKQGLIDIASPPSVLEEDGNVKRWLDGQELSFKDFYKTGELMVIWMKLVTKDVVVTEVEKQAFLEADPSLAILPERIQLRITYWNPGETTGQTTRSLAWESIASVQPLNMRSLVQEQAPEAPESWEGINLYLAVDNLAPRLRRSVAGKKEGDEVGPIGLEDGTTMIAQIEHILPEVSLLETTYLDQWVCLQVALSKVNGQEKFDELVESYFEKNPAVRGFWSSVWDGVKTVGKFSWKNLSYMTGGAGALIGGLYGGPAGAIAGFQYGKGVGSSIKGAFSNGRQAISPPRNIPAMPPMMPPRGNYQAPYVSPMPQNYGQNYQNYYQQPSYMQAGYQQPYRQQGYGYPPPPPRGYPQPHYQNAWAPPMYPPSPMIYY